MGELLLFGFQLFQFAVPELCGVQAGEQGLVVVLFRGHAPQPVRYVGEILPKALEVVPGLPAGVEAGCVPGVMVQQGHPEGGIAQPESLVLGVDVDELLRKSLQDRQGHGLVIDEAPRTSRPVQGPADQKGVALLQVVFGHQRP